MKVNEEYIAKIEKLTNEGVGIARADNCVVKRWGGEIERDNFRIIYKTLHILERAMDLDEFNADEISPENLRISENRWVSIMEMLSENDYISGISINRPRDGAVLVNQGNIRITLKGLEYLSDNSMMKKAAAVAKGIVDIVK